MVTQLNLSENLVEEAMAFNDPTTTLEDLVEIALQEYVERRKRLQILELFDSVEDDKDYYYKQQQQSAWGARTLEFTWDDAKNLKPRLFWEVEFWSTPV